jgi:hypothetical protein
VRSVLIFNEEVIIWKLKRLTNIRGICLYIISWDADVKMDSSLLRDYAV